jgi:glycosyltransferase involved in cell wall biosynthesis
MPRIGRKRAKPSVITLADLARDAGQWEIAARYYQTALSRNPRRPPIWVQYGHVLKEAGQLRQAEEAYLAAIANDRQYADAYLHFGHVLKLQGRDLEAQGWYLRALTLDPSLDSAADALASLGWSKEQMAELDNLLGSSQLSAVRPRSETPLCLVSGERTGEEKTHAPGIHESRQTIPDAENQTRAQKSSPVLPPSPRQFRVLYVSGACNTPGHRYRVTHYIDALAGIGIDAQWVRLDDCESNIHRLKQASLVVIWRSELTPALSRFMEAAKQAWLPLVFDTDDYVFEPEIAKPMYIDGIRGWSDGDIEGYRTGVRAYRDTLLSCQFATFTTNFLVQRGKELGLRSFLLPNGLDQSTIEFSREANNQRAQAQADGVVRIGYAGGTHTHQRDFAQCAEAVAAVLRQCPECRLVLFRDALEAPYLNTDEFPSFRGVENRIEWRQHVPFEGVPAEIARFDINIAPLEYGNPFCEAKSELKYFEAGCLAIPSIVSPTAAFRDAVRHGETGYLAASPEDWSKALLALVKDRALRERIGNAARKHVLEAYGPDALAQAAYEAYRQIIEIYRAEIGREDDALTVTMALPGYSRGSGGIAKAISLMRGLSQRGHDVALHFPDDNFETTEHIRQDHGLHENVPITCGKQILKPSDVAVATHWETAYFLHGQPTCATVKAYFLQDYEPLFYAMGDKYIGAERSYRLGLRHVSYGPWVRDRVKREVGVECDWVPFFIDKAIFYPDPEVQRSSSRLVVFARPELRRRLWALTVTAIELFLNQTQFSGTVEFFGSNASVDLPFPYIWRGVITPQEMAVLFREATVGVALSSTNVSMVPFEMMACGLPVVDIDYRDNYINYGSRENVCLLPPEPESIAAGLAQLLSNNATLDSLSRNALGLIQHMPDEASVVYKFEQLLKEYLIAQSHGLSNCALVEPFQIPLSAKSVLAVRNDRAVLTPTAVE